MIRAIAWDDDPERDEKGDLTYMYQLKEKLAEHYDIDLVVEPDAFKFSKKFEEDGPWRFIVTDLVEETVEGEADVYRGYNLALDCRHQNSTIPIFMVTGLTQAVIRKTIKVPPPFFLFAKELSPSWIAMDIQASLQNLGQGFDPKKVFLIFGREAQAPGAKDKIVLHLQEKGIQVEVLSPSKAIDYIATEVLKLMNRCSVCIALCTPDDFVRDNDDQEYWQPRQNVIMEMGMIMGIANGMKRLVILQRKGPKPELTARLPTDLSGILTLPFEKADLSDVWNDLDEALKARGVEI